MVLSKEKFKELVVLATSLGLVTMADFAQFINNHQQ